MRILAQQLEFDFFSAPEVRNPEKPDWLVKAENLVSTLVGPKGTNFSLPRNRYETVRSWTDYSDIDTTHAYQRSIKLSDAGHLGSGKFIKNENGKVRLLTDEDELIISSHLAGQGFLVSQYPDKSWRFQKKFLEALRNHAVSPFPEPLRDYSDTLYRYFLGGLQYDGFDPEVRNLGEPSITEIEQPEYFPRWYGFEPFIDKVTQDIRTYSLQTAGPKFNRYLTDNQYLDLDQELYGRKAFFSEKFKEDMKRGTLAPFPPELSELNPFREELFNDIGRVFGIDTPQLAKSREENTQSAQEDFSKHPIYQWVRENAPKLKNFEASLLIKALETPGILSSLENKYPHLYLHIEDHYEATKRTFKDGFLVDNKAEELLEQACLANVLENLALDLDLSFSLTKDQFGHQEFALSESEEFLPNLIKLSAAANKSFEDYRDSLSRTHTPSANREEIEKHPLYLWVKENAPKAEIDPTPILKALERPGLLPLLDKKNSYFFRNPEDRFQSKLRTNRNDKALDEKGEKLLHTACRLDMLSIIAEDVSKVVVNSDKGIDAEYRNHLFELSRNADNAFFKHRDSLKYNKDSSLKLEDFGENLNNTRKGRTVNRTNSSHQFLCEPISDIEKRLASESLEKVWPKSSILELYKENAQAAACLWIVRSSLGERRPQKGSYKYRNYLRTASAAIGLHRQVLTGELAPEAETEAFDRFYMARDNYKILSHVNPKYWPFFNPDRIGDAQKICEWNGLKLTDGSDINSYKYQCVLPGAGNTEDNPLCLMNSEGKRYSFYAVAVGNTAEEFEANIEKQLSVSFAKQLQATDKSAQEEKDIGNKAKPELPIKFLGRGVRSTSTYEVYGKQGTIELQLTERIAFENDKAFWDYIENHRAELESKYRELRAEYSKTEKDWRSSTPIRDRIGPDYREGKDATPDMFMHTFGFRGVEFGNWVKQGKSGKERQWMLNNAYDARYDLSKILNIPPKAVALNRDLGLCFGSRGFGSASAHYEPDTRVINLTKTKGYSSLAHEWFHALDHHMARNMYEAKLFESKFLSDKAESVRYGLSEEYKEKLKKQIEPYTKTPEAVISHIERTIVRNPMFHLVKNDTPPKDAAPFELEDIKPFVLEIKTRHAGWRDGAPRTYEIDHRITKNDIQAIPFEHENKIRSEVFHAWGETIEAIRGSSMHQRMLKKNNYWHSKIEEAARSFEAFVEVRSKELGIRNDFLTNDAYRKEPEKKQSYYPYLDGEDVENVKGKFQKLFEVIKTKETDKGVELYSKTREKNKGASVPEIQLSLEEYFGKKTVSQLIDSGKLQLVSSFSEAEKELLTHPSLLQSKRNKNTGFVVPDELAHKANPVGCIAVLNPKEEANLPRGNIVVLPGYHNPLVHKGKGARHLTGTVLENSKRNLYPEEENKTEASLKTVLKILSSADEIYKETQIGRDAYHFYSGKLGMAVCTYYDGNNFAVITQKPVKNPDRLWGKPAASLKGALEIPFAGNSVNPSSLIQDIGGKQTEHRPAAAHEETYVDADYTAAIAADIEAAKARYKSEENQNIQGLYSSVLKKSFLVAENLSSDSAPSVVLHEIGVHMAYDSELRSKVEPLIRHAPLLIEEGFKKRDPVCMAAEIRLKDSGIAKHQPNYAEEAAAYLVEECSKQRSELPRVQRWYKQMRSTVSVWLVNHGFKDCHSLTVDDFVTIANANVRALAQLSRQKAKTPEHQDRRDAQKNTAALNTDKQQINKNTKGRSR